MRNIFLCDGENVPSSSRYFLILDDMKFTQNFSTPLIEPISFDMKIVLYGPHGVVNTTVYENAFLTLKFDATRNNKNGYNEFPRKLIHVINLETGTYDVALEMKNSLDRPKTFKIENFKVDPNKLATLSFTPFLTVSMFLCFPFGDTKNCHDSCPSKDELYPEESAVKYYVTIFFDGEANGYGMNMDVIIQSKPIYHLKAAHNGKTVFVLPLFSNSPLTIVCAGVYFENLHYSNVSKKINYTCKRFSFSLIFSKSSNSVEKYHYKEYSYNIFFSFFKVFDNKCPYISILVCLRSNDERYNCDYGMSAFRFSPNGFSNPTYPLKLRFPYSGKLLIEIIIRKYKKTGYFERETLIYRSEIFQAYIKIFPHFEICSPICCIYFLNHQSKEEQHGQNRFQLKLNRFPNGFSTESFFCNFVEDPNCVNAMSMNNYNMNDWQMNMPYQAVILAETSRDYYYKGLIINMEDNYRHLFEIFTIDDKGVSSFFLEVAVSTIKDLSISKDINTTLSSEPEDCRNYLLNFNEFVDSLNLFLGGVIFASGFKALLIRNHRFLQRFDLLPATP